MRHYAVVSNLERLQRSVPLQRLVCVKKIEKKKKKTYKIDLERLLRSVPLQRLVCVKKIGKKEKKHTK